ncbi:MAG: sigma-70 family RNA polymerase sigma factor, partial [Clostridiales bacterium]|nr:sigma-70 family RNA polymerase sigma factor [Clostridiales bacterium]
MGNHDRDYIEEWKHYKETKSIEARNELVLKYMDLVKKIVLRFNGSYSNFGQLDDMVNQGILALIDAVERFDLDYKNKFETYATVKIRGAIIDYIRKQDWVPREQRTLSKELDNVYSELYSIKGSEPTKDEIAERMDITV